MTRDNIVIAHDIRSTHNVGSLLRTCEGLGVSHVYFTGYTPYPVSTDDGRLPHVSAKLANQIRKTALGAETMVPWTHIADVTECVRLVKDNGYTLVALEQAPRSISLPDFWPPQKTALVLGREVEGIDAAVLALCDEIVEIPMLGRKESFNVVQAAAMALYHFRFFAG